MRKLILTFLPLILLTSVGYSQSKIWIEFDGSYFQKYDGLIAFGEENTVRHGSFRPFFGLRLGNSWSIGMMGDLLSYRDRERDAPSYFPIFDSNPPDPLNPQLIGYHQYLNSSAKTNEYFSLGLFVRKDIQLGKRTSLNFTTYGLKGKGENGIYEVYPEYRYSTFPGWACANCLSVVAGPLEYKFKEESWRFGLDLGFSWELNSWMGLGLRANLLQFRKQILSSYPQITNGYLGPTLFPNSNSMDYGNRFDFGTAVIRDGIRFSVNFRPFSDGKGEAQ